MKSIANMPSMIYLTQSRRLVKILKATLGINHPYTSYSAWEYSLPQDRSLDLHVCYTPDWGLERFAIVNHKGETLFATNSIKAIINYIKEL